jgi:hypothetical protein
MERVSCGAQAKSCVADVLPMPAGTAPGASPSATVGKVRPTATIKLHEPERLSARAASDLEGKSKAEFIAQGVRWWRRGVARDVMWTRVGCAGPVMICLSAITSWLCSGVRPRCAFKWIGPG